MKKSARVSEKLLSPGLPGLQVATRLDKNGLDGGCCKHTFLCSLSFTHHPGVFII